jgi:nicotinate-nucleotide adenylyltransferase
MQSIGVLGGAFDPIHFGHLRAALELKTVLDLGAVHFVPSRLPPHRELPQADAAIRLRMVSAAISGCNGFVADDRELGREGPSYSVDTLISMRDDYPEHALCLLLGMDAFLRFDQWKRWEEIPQLAHIAIAHRPGWNPPSDGALGGLIERHGRLRPADLQNSPNGCIYLHPATQLDISSTDLRQLVGRGQDPRFLVPAAVASIIAETGCYGPARASSGAGVQQHA